MKLFRDLRAVEQDAAGALDRDAQASLFDRLDWFRLLLTHCPPAGDLLVLRARVGEMRAWLFLTVDGRRASALANWYSLEYGVITAGADDGSSARLADALIGGLRRARIAAVEFAPLSQGDALSLAFRDKPWLHRITPSTVRWRMNLTDRDFASYWAGRPSRLRNTAARKAKAGMDIAIHTKFDVDAWTDYERVYQASWKPEEGSPAFLRALAEQEGAAGTLRLGIARKDGAPIAAQFWLTEGGVATIHKLAYVEAAKALSPGTVLGMAMFRHALDVDRVDWIDFGLGDDGYKADWIDDKSVMNRLVAYDLRDPLGAWWAAKAAAGSLVRRVRND